MGREYIHIWVGVHPYLGGGIIDIPPPYAPLSGRSRCEENALGALAEMHANLKPLHGVPDFPSTLLPIVNDTNEGY